MRGYSFETQDTFTFNISDFVLFGPQSWVCGVQVLLSNTGCYHFYIIENINKPPFKFVIGSSTIRKKYGQEAPFLLHLVSLHLGEKTHTHILKAMHLNDKGGLEQWSSGSCEASDFCRQIADLILKDLRRKYVCYWIKDKNDKALFLLHLVSLDWEEKTEAARV